MPEKMKFCPNCNQELAPKQWIYNDNSKDDWSATEEEWFCECPHCKKIIWTYLPYKLNENKIEMIIEGE